MVLLYKLLTRPLKEANPSKGGDAKLRG